MLASHPEVDTYFTVVGFGAAGQVNRGTGIVRMVPRSEREMDQTSFVAVVRQELAEIPGFLAFIARPSPIGGQRGEPLQFSVVGPELLEVARLSQLLQQRLAANAALGRIDLDLQIDLPLALPGLGAAAVFAFLAAWNEYQIASVLTKTPASKTFPVGLADFTTQFTVDWRGMAAMSVLMMIPAILFVLAMQRSPTKGLTFGAVKG